MRVRHTLRICTPSIIDKDQLMYRSKTQPQSMYISWIQNTMYDIIYIGTILCRMGGEIHDIRWIHIYRRLGT